MSNAKTISFSDFKSLAENEEGIVLLGAGGDLTEWVNGVFGILKKAAITTAADASDLFYEQYVLTTTGNRTDLALLVNFDKVETGKLAMWRIGFGDCSWISDYLVNCAGEHGLVYFSDDADADDETDNEQTDDKPVCELIGTDSNVFSIIGAVMKTLKRADMSDKAYEFRDKAQDCDSYDEVLNLTHEYVTVR